MATEDDHELAFETPSPARPHDSSTVFIASEDVLARWAGHVAAPPDLLAFADADAQHALDVIRQRRPQVVVFEQLFASTTRDEPLVRHLQSNPALSDVEIRMLSTDRSSSLGRTGSASGVMLANLAQPMHHTPGPIRRSRWVKTPDGAEFLVDGVPAALIDLSTIGAQVVSSTILRPSQHVHVVLTRVDALHRAPAAAAWSMLELARDAATYCVGPSFGDSHPEFLKVTGDLA